MQVAVTDECRAGDVLREDVEQAADEVISGIGEFSGMRLPDTVQVRLLSPRALCRANRELMSRIFAAMDRRHPDIPPVQMQAARILARAVSRATMAVFWRGVGGQYIPALDGSVPQVLIMPRALRLARANRRELRVILAHELTHAAQDYACPMLSVDAAAQVIAIPAQEMRARKKELAQLSPVIEGHAQWVHLRVCRDMYGLDVRGREHCFDGKGAWSYRLSKAAARRIPVTSGKTRDYDTGEKFINHLFDAGGLPLVNRLWHGFSAMPTVAEMETPELWIKRVGDSGPAH